MQTLFSSGEWSLNSGMFPEEIASAKNKIIKEYDNISSNSASSSSSNNNYNNNSNSSSSSSNGIFPFSNSLSETESSQTQLQLQLAEGRKQKAPKVLPIKSFQNELFNLNIFAHSF